MRAIRLVGSRAVEVQEAAEPSPRSDEIVVAVRACGICGSDLNAWRGVEGVAFPLEPGAPGHEVWGEVAACGSPALEREFPRGTLVTGLAQQGYAEKVLARATELIPLPAWPRDRLLLGEPLACAANVLRRAAVPPDSPVAIVGFGYLAALIAQLLFPEGGPWIAISRRAASRELALSLGAQHAYDFGQVPSTAWESFPVVIEAAGVQEALDHATWLTAERGRLVIAGYHADGQRMVNMQTWNWKGLDVVNAHERDPQRYIEGLRAGLELLARDNLRPDRLITHRWPLEAAAEAFATAEGRPSGFVKGVLVPWTE